jgi:hypothetical protein
MSVTRTYCLWLHKHPSTEALAVRIDAEDWSSDRPARGTRGSDILYYWRDTPGPFFKSAESGSMKWLPLEALIHEVALLLPDLEQHYALFVWVEGEYQRTDGYYDYDLHAEKIIMISDPHEVCGDYEDHRREVRGMFEVMTST